MRNIATYKKNKSKLQQKIIIPFLVIFLFFLSNSTFYDYYSSNVSRVFVLLAGVLTIILFFISFPKISFQSVGNFLLFCFMIIFAAIVSGFNIYVVFLILRLSVIFLLLSSCLYLKIDFLKLMERCVFVFSVWALINYALNIFNIHFLPITSSVQRLYEKDQFIYGYILIDNYSRFSFKGISIPRLSYPFSEPGVAQLFFNFGLFYWMFLSKRKSTSFIFFYFICTIMTLSLTGVFILLSLCFIYLLKRKKFTLLFWLSLVSIPIGIIIILEKYGGISYNERTIDYYISFQTALYLFPWGKGLNNPMPLIISNPFGGNGYYCGLINLFIDFGLFGIIYIVFLIHVINFFKKKYSKFAFFVATILLFGTLITEPIQYSNIFLILIMLSIVYPDKKTLEFIPQYAYIKN